MYGDLADFFSIGAGCVNAQYGLRSDGSISVLNEQNWPGVGGALQNVTGHAILPDPSVTGKLAVIFDFNPSVQAPYWIVALGPNNWGPTGDLYSYAVVTDNMGLSLFVLARDPKQFEAEFDAEVQKMLKGWGFTGFLNSPSKTPQDGCKYH